MEIILKEDIIGLGYKNDIVNVKSGYGQLSHPEGTGRDRFSLCQEGPR